MTRRRSPFQSLLICENLAVRVKSCRKCLIPVGKVHKVAPIAQDTQMQHDKEEDKSASAR